MSYFGYWVSAFDPDNHLQLYSGDTLIFDFDAGSVSELVSGDTRYYGNPNTGRNQKEPYVFVSRALSSTTNSFCLVKGLWDYTRSSAVLFKSHLMPSCRSTSSVRNVRLTRLPSTSMKGVPGMNQTVSSETYLNRAFV